MKWDEAISKVKDFLLNLSEDEKIFLLHHGDCDGCVSAVYLTKLLMFLKHNITRRFAIGSFSYDLQCEKNFLKDASVDVLFCLDLDLISDGILLGEWKSGIKKIFIYDHHKIDIEELNSLKKERPDIFYLNPRYLEEPASYPSSYFGYWVFKSIFPEKELNEWLLAAGLLGDHALEEHPEIKEIVRINYRTSLIEENQLSYRKKLSEITSLINAGYFYRLAKEEDLPFHIAATAFDLNDPGYFFETNFGFVKELHKRKKIISKECEYLVEESKLKAEIEEKIPLLLYRIETEHYLSGLVASELAAIYRNRVIMVGQKINGKISYELRTGKSCTIDLTEVLQEQKKSYRCLSSGGHPKASGALIIAEDEKKFITSFKSALSKISCVV